MKNIIKYFVVIVTLLMTFKGHAQTKPGSDEFIQQEPEDFDLNGGTNRSDDCDGNCGGFGDFIFSSTNSINVAITNQLLWNQVRNSQLEAWRTRQEGLIKDKIEELLNDSFNSYQDAREALSVAFEMNNANYHKPNLIKEIGSSKSDDRIVRDVHENNYIGLQIRKNEIMAGNLNNPEFGHIKVKGKYLKDLRSISEVNNLINQEIESYGVLFNQVHEDDEAITKLNSLGATFNNYVIQLQNNRYNSVGDMWEQLDYVQFLIHLYFTQINNTPHVIAIPEQWHKFGNIHFMNKEKLKAYAYAGGSLSIFHPDFYLQFIDHYLRYANWNQYEAKDMAEQHQVNLQQQHFNDLLNNHNRDKLIVESLIGVLNINNVDINNWLRNNIPIAIEIYNFLDNDYNSNKLNLAFEAVDIHFNLSEFDNYIKNNNFDALDNPWLKLIREYAKRISELKDKVSHDVWNSLNKSLDSKFIYALNLTAKKLTPSVSYIDEVEKESFFLDHSKEGVGVLLYEFANGLGKDVREFDRSYKMNIDFFSQEVVDEIKNDFDKQLLRNNLSFSEFVSNGKKIPGGYSFSPDHTNVIDSFNKHLNANWVRFFVGGASIDYIPVPGSNFIDVVVKNQTSRNSLLLHIGDNYDRNVLGKIPLSTIKQYFYIRIKVR